VGVGVGIGGSGPQPGSTDKDRAAMETELTEKGLPEGAASAPVSGYVYFQVARKKNQTFTLEYTVNGEKVQLRLPQ
jgi:nicotinamide mononucleotide (NMN) deamidase PncC